MSKWYESIVWQLPDIKIQEINPRCLLINNRITLHQDIFETRKEQVYSRLASINGLNTDNIFARNTHLVEISKEEAKGFIDQNHIMGFGGGKTFLGLRDDTELVAIAVFSKILYMKYEDPPYHSVELERYCSLIGTTVVGGLDKLIQAYLKEHEVDDIVTYIDKEWSNGASFKKLGFENVEDSEPLIFKISKDTLKREQVSERGTDSDHAYYVCNKGNFKLRLRVNQH